MPYALSNLQDGRPPSWRAIASEMDLAEGEVYVDVCWSWLTVGRLTGQMGTHGPMKQGKAMKRGFSVLHDQGMGGIWAYVLAESEDRVRREFPDLEVYSDPPSWMTQELFTHIKERSTLDIDQMDEEEDLVRILKGHLQVTS